MAEKMRVNQGRSMQYFLMKKDVQNISAPCFRHKEKDEKIHFRIIKNFLTVW
jgi:hypothetical protein